MVKVAEKTIVSIVSNNIPLKLCPLETEVFISKDKNNPYDEKALAAFVRHKRTGKWTFIGYVANNPNYISPGGISNTDLHDMMTEKLGDKGCMSKVVDKIDVIFPYDTVSTALLVEVDLDN